MTAFRIIDTSGESNQQGFRVRVLIEKEGATDLHKYECGTEGFQEDYWPPSTLKAKVIILALFIVLVGVFFLYPFSFLQPSYLRLLLAAISAYISSLLMLYLKLFLSADLREYHACEHKVINLITIGIPPTLGGLRKTPRFIEKCGTEAIQFITTKEPSEDKLKEGLRVAEIIYKNMHSPSH